MGVGGIRTVLAGEVRHLGDSCSFRSCVGRFYPFSPCSKSDSGRRAAMEICSVVAGRSSGFGYCGVFASSSRPSSRHFPTSGGVGIFDAVSGIKQVCPMSGSISAFANGPPARSLLAGLLLGRTSYADDIAMLLCVCQHACRCSRKGRGVRRVFRHCVLVGPSALGAIVPL